MTDLAERAAPEHRIDHGYIHSAERTSSELDDVSADDEPTREMGIDRRTIHARVDHVGDIEVRLVVPPLRRVRRAWAHAEEDANLPARRHDEEVVPLLICS